MTNDKITFEDIKEYEKLFSMAPSFLLERFAKKNTNVVLKFKSQIESHLSNLNDNQKRKLDIIINSDINMLQSLMEEAHRKTNKKQYKILANPKYREFIETNMEEIKKMINNF